MSKSIYEEALEIVDESLYQQDNSVIFNRLGLKLLKKSLEQAQKQEKLLSLYKELSNYACEQCYAHKLPEITRLKILIKELEKEVKTLWKRIKI